MFEVSATKPSVVIASTAGSESRAKTRSVVSITIRTRKSGVTAARPFSLVKKRGSFESEVTGSQRRTSFTAKLFSGCTSSSSLCGRASLTPV